MVVRLCEMFAVESKVRRVDLDTKVGGGKILHV